MACPISRSPLFPRAKLLFTNLTRPPREHFFIIRISGFNRKEGLVGPLAVEESKPHVQYDREFTLALSDFLPGPPVPLGMSCAGGDGMRLMQVPPYVALLINGRPPEAPAVFEVKNGERVRIRLINMSGTSVYRFAIGSHPFAVTHSDGRPVEPLTVDAVYLAPGERHDILLEARNPGSWPIAASADTDLPPARAILRYADSSETAPREGRAAPFRRAQLPGSSDVQSTVSF